MADGIPVDFQGAGDFVDRIAAQRFHAPAVGTTVPPCHDSLPRAIRVRWARASRTRLLPSTVTRTPDACAIRGAPATLITAPSTPACHFGPAPIEKRSAKASERWT